MRLPPRETRVPFRKIREKLAEILRWQLRNRPIEGGLLEFTPNGFRVRDPDPPRVPFPPFHPTMGEPLTDSSRLLYIEPGYVYAPKSDGTDKEIPSSHLYPVMAQINSVDLDDGTRPTLTLQPDVTNYVYCEINLTRRTSALGAHDIPNAGPATNTGIKVLIENTYIVIPETDDGSGVHSHNNASGHPLVLQDSTASAPLKTASSPTASSHTHWAILEANLYTYHLDTAAGKKAQIKVSTDEFPPDQTPAVPDTELVHNIPMGKFDLDANGDIIDVGNHWWATKENIYYYPPQYISGASADASANPT